MREKVSSTTLKVSIVTTATTLVLAIVRRLLFAFMYFGEKRDAKATDGKDLRAEEGVHISDGNSVLPKSSVEPAKESVHQRLLNGLSKQGSSSSILLRWPSLKNKSLSTRSAQIFPAADSDAPTEVHGNSIDSNVPESTRFSQSGQEQPFRPITQTSALVDCNSMTRVPARLTSPRRANTLSDIDTRAPSRLMSPRRANTMSASDIQVLANHAKMSPCNARTRGMPPQGQPLATENARRFSAMNMDEMATLRGYNTLIPQRVSQCANTGDFPSFVSPRRYSEFSASSGGYFPGNFSPQHSYHATLPPLKRVSRESKSELSTEHLHNDSASWDRSSQVPAQNTAQSSKREARERDTGSCSRLSQLKSTVLSDDSETLADHVSGALRVLPTVQNMTNEIQQGEAMCRINETQAKVASQRANFQSLANQVKLGEGRFCSINGTRPEGAVPQAELLSTINNVFSKVDVESAAQNVPQSLMGTLDKLAQPSDLDTVNKMETTHDSDIACSVRQSRLNLLSSSSSHVAYCQPEESFDVVDPENGGGNGDDDGGGSDDDDGDVNGDGDGNGDDDDEDC